MLQNSIEMVDFSHEEPLGTVKNGKEKVKMNPPKWTTLDNEANKKFFIGCILAFRNEDKKTHIGIAKSYEKNGVNLTYLVGNCAEQTFVPENKIKYYGHYRNFQSEICNLQNDSPESKLAKLQSVFFLLPKSEKKDINLPKSMVYVDKTKLPGYLDYKWPKNLGFKEGTARPLSKFPEKLVRAGSLYGNNHSNIEHTFVELSIPYKDNPSCIKKFRGNPHNYKAKINAIESADFIKLNKLMFFEEGLNALSPDEMEDIVADFRKYIKKLIQEGLRDDNMKYGVTGEIAEWNDMKGGGIQFTLPLNAKNMIRLGILYEIG